MTKVKVSKQAEYLNSGVISELVNSRNLKYIQHTHDFFISFCRRMENRGYDFESLSEAWDLFLWSVESKVLRLTKLAR